MSSKTKRKIKGGHLFSKDNQPSPEAKSRGWDRRRESMKIMNQLRKLGDMSYKDFKVLLEDIEKHPAKHTLREVMLARYMDQEKHIIDFLDRHISKAPVINELSGPEGEGFSITVKVDE